MLTCFGNDFKSGYIKVPFRFWGKSLVIFYTFDERWNERNGINLGWAKEHKKFEITDGEMLLSIRNWKKDRIRELLKVCGNW